MILAEIMQKTLMLFGVHPRHGGIPHKDLRRIICNPSLTVAPGPSPDRGLVAEWGASYHAKTATEHFFK